MPRSSEPHRALRAATADAHARLDALVGDWRHTDDYRAYLQGMERFLALCDAALGGGDGGRHEQRRDLAADLHALGAAPLRDRGDAAREDSDAGRLGWEYVLAGASLGARVLLKRAHALGLDADHGAAFLAAHAGSGDWPRLLARLDLAEADPDTLARLCAAASAAFAAAEASFRRALDET